MKGKCSVDGCEKECVAKGYCKKHYRSIYYRERRNELQRIRAKGQKSINMLLLINYFGKDKICCERCGYSRCFNALHAHHLNEKEKNGKHDSLGWWLRHLNYKRFKEKLLSTGLIILCANCHIELHAGDWKLTDKFIKSSSNKDYAWLHERNKKLANRLQREQVSTCK